MRQLMNNYVKFSPNTNNIVKTQTARASEEDIRKITLRILTRRTDNQCAAAIRFPTSYMFSLKKQSEGCYLITYQVYIPPDLTSAVRSHLWYTIRPVVPARLKNEYRIICVRPSALCLAKNVRRNIFQVTCVVVTKGKKIPPETDVNSSSSLEHNCSLISNFEITPSEGWCCFVQPDHSDTM